MVVVVLIGVFWGSYNMIMVHVLIMSLLERAKDAWHKQTWN